MPLKNINTKQLQKAIAKVDIVLDGTDNFDSRVLINKFCHSEKTTLISAAAVGFDGQIAVFKSWLDNNPCYNCLYGNITGDSNRCIESGIASPLVGMLGTMQAMQTINLALDLDLSLLSNLLIVDGLSFNFRKVKIIKDTKCQTCSTL